MSRLWSSEVSRPRHPIPLRSSRDQSQYLLTPYSYNQSSLACLGFLLSYLCTADGRCSLLLDTQGKQDGVSQCLINLTLSRDTHTNLCQQQTPKSLITVSQLKSHRIYFYLKNTLFKDKIFCCQGKDILKILCIRWFLTVKISAGASCLSDWPY